MRRSKTETQKARFNALVLGQAYYRQNGTIKPSFMLKIFESQGCSHCAIEEVIPFISKEEDVTMEDAELFGKAIAERYRRMKDNPEEIEVESEEITNGDDIKNKAVCWNLNPKDVENVKKIARYEGKRDNEVVTEALRMYFNQWKPIPQEQPTLL